MAKFLIGFTQDNRQFDYIRAFHGYKPGAEQVELLVLVPDVFMVSAYAAYVAETMELDPTDVPRPSLEWAAEEFFEATNNPGDLVPGSLAAYFRENLLSYEGYYRSLSSGDTFSEVDYADSAFMDPQNLDLILSATTVCQSVGWARMDISVSRNPVAAPAVFA